MIPYLPGTAADLQQHPLFRNAPGKAGETAFYVIARDKLPETWTVIYNQVVFAENDEHQVDFLVVIPEKGIINVDAKGYNYSWEDGTFYLENTPKDLFGIASSAIHTVDQYIRREILHQTSNRFQWGAYGRCLMFMLQDFHGSERCAADLAKGQYRGIDEQDRIIPGGYPYMTFSDFCQNDCINDQAIIRKFNAELDKHRYAQPGFEKYRTTIIEHYRNQRAPVRRTLKFAENNASLEVIFQKFTERQEEVIQKIIAADRDKMFVHIPGCAGSGKTLLAVFAAKHFLEEGKRVLYVCYNKHLAESMKVTYAGDLLKSGRFDICHFDVLHSVVKREVRFTDNWQENRRNLRAELSEHPIPEDKRYDVIIVDETQDMDENCLKTLFCLFPPTGCFKKLLAFSDDQQSIFENGWEFPAALKSSFHQCERLTANIRNARKVCEKDQEIYKNNSDCVSPQQGKVYSSAKSLNDEIDRLRNEGYQPRNVAVLAFERAILNRETSQLRWDCGEDYSRWKGENTDWNEKTYLWCGCVQGFKGLEADCLILIGNIPKTLLGHTAVTRAKLELIIKA